MTTLQQHYLRLLRAEQEEKMRARHEQYVREQERLRQCRSDLSDAGDLLIGIISALGLTIMAAIIVIAWLR